MAAKWRKGLEVIESLHDYSLDPKNREIYLVGEQEAKIPDDDQEPGVEFLMANRFIKNLRFLSLANENPILVHSKTCGGYWEEGMAIYDAIKACPCYVTILNYTHARSMSSIIFQAADNRVMMPNSYFLFHLGSTEFGGTERAFFSYAEWSKKLWKVMTGIYADRILSSKSEKFVGQTRKQIVSCLDGHMQRKEDVYLTAEETVSWGLADSVFDGDWNALHTTMG